MSAIDKPPDYAGFVSNDTAHAKRYGQSNLLQMIDIFNPLYFVK